MPGTGAAGPTEEGKGAAQARRCGIARSVVNARRPEAGVTVPLSAAGAPEMRGLALPVTPTRAWPFPFGGTRDQPHPA